MSNLLQALPERLFVASSYRDPSITPEERYAACSLLFFRNPRDVGLQHFFANEPAPADWEAVLTYRAGFELEIEALNAASSEG